MEKNRTMRELGLDYEKAAEKVKERILIKRQQLKALRDSVCSNEAYEIKRELQVLYEEYRQAKEISDYLKHYYEPHNGCRELFQYK